MKQKHIITIAAITMILIFAFAFVMVKLIQESNECVSNPFTYAAKQIVDKKGDNIYSLCSCQVGELEFYFDREGLYQANPLRNITERGFKPWPNLK